MYTVGPNAVADPGGSARAREQAVLGLFFIGLVAIYSYAAGILTVTKGTNPPLLVSVGLLSVLVLFAVGFIVVSRRFSRWYEGELKRLNEGNAGLVDSSGPGPVRP